MINCIIVDDEQPAIDIIAHYVKQVEHLNLVGSFTNPVEALQFLRKERIDLVFLDIQMPDLSGIEFIKAIQGKSKVIIITAYAEFALEGYELYVLDYLLKPIRLPRFLSAVEKAIQQIKPENSSLPEETLAEDYIFVKTESKGKLHKINLSEIDFIESLKNYMVIHRGAQKILVYTSMRELEERLPKKHFVRVHKSYIVPINRITGIEGNLVRVKDVPVEIVIGEKYKADLMEIIKKKIIQ